MGSLVEEVQTQSLIHLLLRIVLLTELHRDLAEKFSIWLTQELLTLKFVRYIHRLRFHRKIHVTVGEEQDHSLIHQQMKSAQIQTNNNSVRYVEIIIRLLGIQRNIFLVRADSLHHALLYSIFKMRLWQKVKVVFQELCVIDFNRFLRNIVNA